MQVVGDDLQVIVVEQGAGNRLSGRTDINEQRSVVGDLCGNGFADALFLVAHLIGAHGVGSVFNTGIVSRATVVAAQQIGFRQLIDIAADGLRGNNEQRGHFLDADIAAFADQFEDLLLTGRQIHGASFGLPCKICP
ncbi:hypothetical protein D3C76_1492350 [compost metagenome]